MAKAFTTGKIINHLLNLSLFNVNPMILKISFTKYFLNFQNLFNSGKDI